MTEEQKATCAGAEDAKSGLAGSIETGSVLCGPGWGVMGTTPGWFFLNPIPLVLGTVVYAVYGLYRGLTD